MISLDFSQLSQLERDALDAAARRERPDDTEYTGEAHLAGNVEAMIKTAVEAYVAEQLPDLRELAGKLLNTSPEVRADLIRRLDEAQPRDDKPRDDDRQQPPFRTRAD